MKSTTVQRILLSIFIAASTGASLEASTPRERIRLDADWRFKIDDNTKAVANGLSWTYQPIGSGNFATEAAPSSPQGHWVPTQSGSDIFQNRVGLAWMHATLAPKKNRNQIAHFDGADDNAAVYLNGVRLFSHMGWGDPFDVDLSSHWKTDRPNELYVLIENTAGPGGLLGNVSVEAAESLDHIQLNATEKFDDRGWRHVHLPHDYVVEGKFTPTADASHGSLAVTPAWYRKTFQLPLRDIGKSIWVDFDGVYRSSTVWLNGHRLGNHPSGYTGFRYDLSRWAHFGGPNVLAVRVDPRRPEGWWYEGGGIYRHVWLNVADPVHIKPDTLFVRENVHGAEGDPHPSADVIVDTELKNDLPKSVVRSLQNQVFSPRGSLVAEATSHQISIPALGSVTVHQVMPVDRAELWSVDSPRLYTVRTDVKVDSAVQDSQTTSFGIRTIRWDKDLGFFLNGKPFKIKGTCNHQDHAGVGVAVPDSLLEWRVAQLKKMGSNAYRMSHNPPAKELLDACDRLGMVVMDENRHLGDTESGKTPHGTGYSDLSELKSMVLRDRNHPSIIMWSMCNEELLEGQPEGAKIFSAMQRITKQLDPTRPVTSAMNAGWEGGFAAVEDLLGINYNPGVYDQFHKMYPNTPVYGSETGSTVSTRGIYANDTEKGYVSAYDINVPSWAQSAEDEWQPIAERPWIAGGYVWTGFDYKGEPTPYAWPCINSHFGILDICGFPKDNFYYYKAWWGSEPLVHILPHWNWAGKEGKDVDVWCYSNAESVELILNGKSLGAKAMSKYRHLEWKVPYESGELIANAYRNGKLVATDRVSTTGAPAALRLSTDRNTLAADGEDVTEVKVEVVDAQGRVVPDADNLVSFSVSGQGFVAGVGNGDPSSHEPDKATQRHAFNGLCMALIGSKETQGKATLVVTSKGLKGASLSIASN
jgi:beta-galactosidase